MKDPDVFNDRKQELVTMKKLLLDLIIKKSYIRKLIRKCYFRKY